MSQELKQPAEERNPAIVDLRINGQVWSESENERHRGILMALAFANIMGTTVGLPLLKVMALAEVNPFFSFIPASLFCCQPILIGIWMALGMSHWQSRWLSGFAGLGYLAALLLVVVELNGSWALELCIVIDGIFAPALSVALILLPIRRLVAQLCRGDQRVAMKDRKRLQFSLRHMMSATFLVCLSLPIGMEVRKHFEFNMWAIALAFFSVITALISVWTALGGTNPYFRSLVGMVSLGLLGLGFDSLIGTIQPPVTTLIIMFVSTVMLSNLLVVRHCGYRWVKIKYVYPGTNASKP